MVVSLGVPIFRVFTVTVDPDHFFFSCILTESVVFA